MGKDIGITDDHHCAVQERTQLNVELAKCDVQFEKGEVRESCYESAIALSKERVKRCQED